MNKKTYEKEFREAVLPAIREQYEQNGRMDRPARREAWNNLIDQDVKNGLLPDNAINWICPW